MLATLAQVFLPWWWLVAVVAFGVELALGKGDKLGFFSGFYGIAIPWMLYAAYIDQQNGSILAHRILDLFSLPKFAFVLIIITGLVGGITGGVASMAASWIVAYRKNVR